jgi:polysaccharide biosynthesis/export protein
MGKKRWTEFRTICIISTLILLSSCVPYSRIKYFNDINKLDEPVVNPVKVKTINSFDRIEIKVLSTDQQTADLLNFAGLKNPNQVTGYVVDESGNISFPFVGEIKVGGLTLDEARDVIKKSISSIIKNPEVIVTFENNTITVLGEVNLQGSFALPDDGATIYKSLSLAGGLTQYSNRKNIVLIRKEENKIVHYKLDLTSSDITSSPLYYIVPGDIIIVEPLHQKVWATQNSLIPIITSFITIAINTFTLIKLLK